MFGMSDNNDFVGECKTSTRNKYDSPTQQI